MSYINSFSHLKDISLFLQKILLAIEFLFAFSFLKIDFNILILESSQRHRWLQRMTDWWSCGQFHSFNPSIYSHISMFPKQVVSLGPSDLTALGSMWYCICLCMIVHGCVWLCMAEHDCMTVHSCVWLYMVVHDYAWLSMVVHDCAWLSMICIVVCDCAWLCMAEHGCAWLFMAECSYTKLCMHVQPFAFLWC